MNVKAPAVYIVVFIVLLAAGRALILSDGSRMSAVSNALGVMFQPARSAQKYVRGSFEGLRLYCSSKASLAKKVARLEEENRRLKDRAATDRYYKRRVTDLEELLEIKSFTAFDTVSADVMYHSASSWFHTFTVNAGTEDGVSRGDAVFNSSGLIGQVVETGKNMSVVSSITEGSSSVGGMIDRSGTRGLVQGSYSGYLYLNYLPSDADVKKGDLCSSSGDGRLIPPGIPIGKVVSVSPDKTTDTKIAKVRPFVRVDRLRSVLIAVHEHER